MRQKTRENTTSQEKAFEQRFDAQWGHQYIEIEIAGKKETVRYIDLTPDIRCSDTPVLLVLGWARTPKSYKGLIGEIFMGHTTEGEIALGGRRVLAVEYPRSTLSSDGKLPTQEQKAMTLLSFIQKINLETVDMVAHSEGGINAIRAAQISPSTFRNFVLVGSGGYAHMGIMSLLKKRMRVTNVSKMTPHTSQDHKGVTIHESDTYQPTTSDIEQAKEYRRITAVDVVRTIRRNPVRALAESLQALQIMIPETLRMLKKTGHHILLVHGVNDHVISINDLLTHISKEHVDGIIVTEGDHADPTLYPKQYGPILTKALTTLEKKSIAEELSKQTQ